jgi:Domain of unknown function (DUF4265)
MSEKEFEKIKITLPKSDWHEYLSETAWAKPIGDNQYILESSLFFADGLSYQDIVYAEPVGDNFPEYKYVIRRNGHSTYRVFLKEGTTPEQFEEYFQSLGEIGCSYEGFHERLYSVDVPDQTDIRLAFDILNQGEEKGLWFFSSAHVGHPGQ